MWRTPQRAAGDDAERPPWTGPVDDFSPTTAGPPVSRILVLVAHPRNRALLVDWFADQPNYDVIDAVAVLDGATATGGDGTCDEDGAESTDEGVPHEWRPSTGPAGGRGGADGRDVPDRSPLDGEAIDLCLVDVAALTAHGEWLSNRVDLERPLPLPCLLLASESAVRRFLAPEDGHELNHLVDDVVTTPVEPALLDRRVRGYLRVRRQGAELERRHDQLSLLAQVLRHDIANAATVVTGWGEALREEVTPEGADTLERVLRGGQRVTELVENSRDLTKLIEAGHELDTEATLLAPVLRAEVDAVERIHASTSKQVNIDYHSPPAVVAVVAGGMLPSVFANLLSNAVRHNDAETVEIEVAVEESGDEVLVRVTDNGPGIPDDFKQRVFEPATKRGGSPGDGLGLSLVKRLVDSYGGRVWFEDAPGGGSAACVTLRRADSRP